MEEISQQINNRDFESIDVTRLTKEHMDEIASLISERVEQVEENYLSEGSPHWEYTTSYSYGEVAPDFRNIDCSDLGDYLAQSLERDPSGTMEFLETYIYAQAGNGVFVADNAISGTYLHNEEIEISVEDLRLDGLEDLLIKLDKEQLHYLSSQCNVYMRVPDYFYGSVTGKIEMILDSDRLIDDVASLDPALRLTDTNPIIRNFPTELLEEVHIQQKFG